MRTLISILFLSALLVAGCRRVEESADFKQRAAQEKVTAEGFAQTGLPAIKNFRERKLLKDIYELRDQNGLVTYTYIVADQTGRLVYLGQSVGYGIPASTQYSASQKCERVPDYNNTSYTNEILPQAEPNGLFSPESAEGTWIMLKDPNSDRVAPVYCEQRIIVSPFRLNTEG